MEEGGVDVMLRAEGPRGLPAPLPIEPEELVIVDVVDGEVDSSMVHRPAEKVAAVGKGYVARFDAHDFPPMEWPSACGIVAAGWVYVRAGVLARTPFCPDCESA